MWLSSPPHHIPKHQRPPSHPVFLWHPVTGPGRFTTHNKGFAKKAGDPAAAFMLISLGLHIVSVLALYNRWAGRTAKLPSSPKVRAGACGWGRGAGECAVACGWGGDGRVCCLYPLGTLGGWVGGWG